MPARKPERHEIRSGATAVQRDVLQAAVDVWVGDWTQNAARHGAQVVGPSPWHELSRGWNSDLCGGLSGVADTLNLLTGKPRQLIQWAVAAVLQAHGVPPFLARVIGRLVANWLLAPADPIGRSADRLRILGVLLCAQDGDLAHCSCLPVLAQDKAIEALKQGLEEGLDISPQPAEQARLRPAPARLASVNYEVRARRSAPEEARMPPAVRRRAERPSDAASEGPAGRDPSVDGSAAGPAAAGPAAAGAEGAGPPSGWQDDGAGPDPGTGGHAAESGSVAGQSAEQRFDSPGDDPGAQSAADGAPQAIGTAEDEPEAAGSTPASPDDGPADGPDPRLVRACDLVRGADWVPATAIFGEPDGGL